MRTISGLLAAGVALLATPASAEVTATSENGFAVLNSVEVAAKPEAVWLELLQPGNWWNGEHTYSGDATNMSIVDNAGGCFCETIPATGGQVEHMRVIYVAPNETLRMSGGLGPLQSEALVGTLTISLKPSGEGTRITWDYAVGGFMRLETATIAPLVDAVLREQLTRLVARLGPPNQ